uniref:Apple domain-containing protein n=1 Tax=Panagrolaimus davidi TaxID=227884 RepID=A0A914Q8G0_9BILA
MKPLEISSNPTVINNINNKENAIKLFQQNTGLEVTGKLNDETKMKMTKPRCGVIDIKNVRSTDYVPFKQNLIKYAFINFSEDLASFDIRKVIQKAFDIWSKVIPRNFVEVSSDDPSVNILIQFVKKAHGDGFPFDCTNEVLAHAIPGGYIHFDEDEIWVIYKPNEKVYSHKKDLLSVAIHEIGHSLGLDHTNVENSIIFPYYQDPIDENGNYVVPKLLTSDISDIQEIYGPRLKDNGGGVATAPPPTQKPPPKPGCSAMEPNKDILGNNILFTFGNPQHCCKMCESNSKCKAFVWKNIFNGMCFLKSATAPVISNLHTSLGYPSGSEKCSTKYPNMDIDGSNLGNRPGQQTDCCEICQSTFSCKAYIWIIMGELVG